MYLLKKFYLLTLAFIISCVELFSQNVGISNDATFTTPQSPLHIYWTNDGNLLQLSRQSDANRGLIFSVNLNNYSILNRENAALIFGTNATERMRITNTGNIGIGTNTPTNLVHLFSNTDATLLIQSSSAPNSSSLVTNASGVITRFESVIIPFASGRIITTGNYPIVIATNNTERITISNTGNVGIGTTSPAAQLHTTGTVRFGNYASGANGAILRTNNAGDLSITNFSGSANEVLLGTGLFGSMNNLAWQLTGNSGTNSTNHFIGTIDAQHLVFRTNNTERMRIRDAGDIVAGGTDPGISGDLFGVISTASFQWPINGYANNNGGAFYGEIRSGNATNFSVCEIQHYGSGTGYAILASNNSTNTAANAGTAIFGSSASNHNGSDYYSNNYGGILGVGAYATTQYSFGVIGRHGGTGVRSGGVMGTYWTNYWGSLGYVRSNGTPYGLCYIGGVTTVAKSTTNISQVKYGIGMGGWGELMGGHIKGDVYGLHVSGERYSLYVNGTQFINKTIVKLNNIDNSNERVPTYMSTSLNNDLIDKGVVDIKINQETKIYFSTNFSKLVDKNKPIIVTITPIGKNVSAYIISYDDKGVIIKCEFNNNNIVDETKNMIKINWIAIGTLKENVYLPNEILSKNYDEKIEEFLVNEGDTSREAIPMWWDGQQLRFEPIPKQFINKIPLSKEDVVSRRNMDSKK